VKQVAVDADAFNAFEAAGWERKARTYDRYFGALTARLLDRLLDAADVGPRSRVLDVATGPGHGAASAASRGARALGIDIAAAMVALAAESHPSIAFRQADAHDLPFPDGSFDAVIGNFAILHLGYPEQAVAEFARVLAPGGRLALTAWDTPERTAILEVLIEAIAEARAEPPEGIPAGPDFFRYAEDDVFDALLGDAGLADRYVRTVELTHTVESPDELWDGLLGGTVRTSSLVERQPDAMRHDIRRAFDRGMRAYRREGEYELPVSVKLAAGTRPA
jgi:ubiquinone/menaquinone biosynthesis C-methylase UbiE